MISRRANTRPDWPARPFRQASSTRQERLLLQAALGIRPDCGLRHPVAIAGEEPLEQVRIALRVVARAADRQRGFAGHAPVVIDDLALQNADQPGRRCRITAKTAQGLQGGDQRVLDQILGDGCFPHLQGGVAQQRRTKRRQAFGREGGWLAGRDSVICAPRGGKDALR